MILNWLEKIVLCVCLLSDNGLPAALFVLLNLPIRSDRWKEARLLTHLLAPQNLAPMPPIVSLLLGVVVTKPDWSDAGKAN